jgi:hypothetical protein
MTQVAGLADQLGLIENLVSSFVLFCFLLGYHDRK